MRCPFRSMWKSLPAHSAWATPCRKLSPAIVSCATSGFTPTISGWASRSMKASACPTVGRKMSPRGSFGFGSILQRVAAHIAVVRGEGAVLEDRVGEQVGGGHRDLHAGLAERLAETREDALALARLGPERDQVVVVEADPVRAQVRQPADGFGRVQSRACGLAERIVPLVADCPEPKGELVLRTRRQIRRGRAHLRLGCHLSPLSLAAVAISRCAQQARRALSYGQRIVLG